ncbi:uncharacterized protein LY89DRAFT_720241 [Mollisia scopiformis]|uniref:Uncharacterized protein n=1 Tax=Mollisia scopiformis TaxID=149040 RepID=A0A194X3L9_MOLSC|nr:uncharacterized protein LY89DRAFT_720241 [Mollisia scopiformis]KUJ14766.1 hypothetical protein LY89DRAFT_720241 [Mollisia scopiformis]
MDFGFATISLVVQTVLAVTEHRKLLENRNHFLDYSLPTRQTAISHPVSTDIGILCSTCISSGLLTSIYQRGRSGKLQTPLFLATIVGSFASWGMIGVPVDILALTVFEWMVTLVLLVSRYCEHILLSDLEAGDAAFGLERVQKVFGMHDREKKSFSGRDLDEY